MNRRTFLGTAASTLVASGGVSPPLAEARVEEKKPTKFQIACMTLPYSRFTLNRALEGIKGAGYSFVAWGTTHNEDGKNVPVIARDAAPEKAKELGLSIVALGIVSTKHRELESEDQLMREIDAASKYLDVEQLALTPQCGFGTVAILQSVDEETQWRKLALVGAVADRVWSR